MIYFISNGTYTKIGKADEPKKRLKELQTGCPEKLEIKLVIDGGEDKERMLHKALNKYRFRGEWFHINFNYNEELIEEILYLHKKLNGEKRVVKVKRKVIDAKKAILNSINIIKKDKESATIKDISDLSGVGYLTTRKYVDLMADRLDFIDGFKVIRNQHKETSDNTISELLRCKEELISNGVKVNKMSLHKASGISRPTIDKHWSVIKK